MIPTQLTIKNFQGIREADLAIAPLTLFFGINGAGKTSITRALDYLLTGKTAYGPAVNLAGMIRQGEKALHVAGKIDGILYERHRTKTTAMIKRDGAKVPDGSVERGWSMSTDSIAASLRAGQLFDLKPAELLTLLRSLLPDLAPSPERIAEELGVGVAESSVLIDVPLPQSLDDFAAVSMQAEKHRQASKRKRTDLKADLKRIAEPEGEAGSKALVQIQNADGDEQAARERLESVLSGMHAQVATAKAATDVAAAFDRGGLEATAKHQRERITELEPLAGEGSGPVAELAAVDDRLAVAEVSLREAEREADEDASAAERRQAGADEAWTEPSDDGEIAELKASLGDSDADSDKADAQVTHWTAETERHAAVLASMEDNRDELRAEHARLSASLDEVPGAAAQQCPTYPDTECPLKPTHFKRLRKGIEENLSGIVERGKGIAYKITEAMELHDASAASLASATEAAERCITRERIAALTTDRAELTAASKASHGARVSTATEALAAIRAALTAAQTRIEQLTQQTAADRLTAEDLRAKVANARAANEAAHALQEARDRLAAADAALQAPAPGTPDDMTATLERIEAGQAIVDAVKVYERRSSKQAEIDSIQAMIDHANEVAKATGAGGVRARMIADAAAPLLVKANGSLDQFTEGYSVSLECDGDLQFRVQTPEADVLAVQLSDGEKMRVLYVLQYAVAQLAGVGIIAIDKVELVDDEARRELFATCRAWAESGMTVLMLNNKPAPDKVPAGVAAYAVADGLVTRIAER